MAIESLLASVTYFGNASTSTPYQVPFSRISEYDLRIVVVQQSGTAVVTAGVAVFSVAQASLEIGDKVRIGNITYEIATRTSSTVFTLTTRPTISSSPFWSFNSGEVESVNVGSYTLTGSTTDGYLVTGGEFTTAEAFAATSLVIVYRETPQKQPTNLPMAGKLPAASLEAMADRLTMLIQEQAARMDGYGVGLPIEQDPNVLEDTAVFADAAARALAVPKRVGQLGIQLSPAPFRFYRSTGITAGQWDQYADGDQSIPSWNNQGMTALVASAVGDCICNTGVTTTPIGRTDVYVNTQRWLVGDGVKTLGVYFSADAGATARAVAAIIAGDKAYLGTLGAALGTDIADTISFCYNL